jgi:hypothetical protein
MTTEQALKHPWIMNSLLTSEDRKSGSSEEAVVEELGIPRKGAMISGHIINPKPKKRRSWNILSL